jgi:hypothetical protein
VASAGAEALVAGGMITGPAIRRQIDRLSRGGEPVDLSGQGAQGAAKFQVLSAVQEVGLL